MVHASSMISPGQMLESEFLYYIVSKFVYFIPTINPAESWYTWIKLPCSYEKLLIGQVKGP